MADALLLLGNLAILGAAALTFTLNVVFAPNIAFNGRPAPILGVVVRGGALIVSATAAYAASVALAAL